MIFQPHRYTRTHLLFDDFVSVLNEPDALFILDIYSAGEPPIDGVNSEKLAGFLKGSGHENVFYVRGQDEAAHDVLKILKTGDLVLTLGAGDVWKVGEKIVKEIS